MQALASSGRGSRAALQQAGRLLSSTSAVARSQQSGHDGEPAGQQHRAAGGRSQGPAPQQAPSARRVHGSGDAHDQDDAQPQHRQPQVDDGPSPPRRWQRRLAAPSPDEGSLRANYVDGHALQQTTPYVRVAPKPEQRQARVYPAYIYNVSPCLLRTDVAAFFDGHGLGAEEIRPEYSWGQFGVERFWLNFGSGQDREWAMSRHMAYLGTRRVLMRRATPQEFTAGIYNPLAMSSRGRYVLVDNLAPVSTSEDVIRFFHGYDLHPKSVTFMRESTDGGSADGAPRVRSRTHAEKAVVRFASPLEAHRAVRERQAAFCGNNAVRLRLLQ